MCPPGYKGDFCDIPDCRNNKLPDANGNCVCAQPGQTNQYIDALCTYRWCGPAGNRVCLGGACICICDDRQGVYINPTTGNCTLPVCGSHSTFDVASLGCVCDAGYVKDTSVPLQPCVRTCGTHGTYNAIAGACVCDVNHFGADCEFDTTAFVQRLLAPGTTVTLPNGIVVEAASEAAFVGSEAQIGSPAPSATVQVVLFDPLPDPLSYQEDAENAIRNSIPGYTIVYDDLLDLVHVQSGLDPVSASAGQPEVSEIIVEVPESDSTLSASYYAVSVAAIAATAVAGAIIVATYAIALTHNV